MFNADHVRAISVQELKRLRDDQADIQVIDVREVEEVKQANMGADKLIPLGQVDVRYDEISRDKPVVIHCKSGRRSHMAVLFLQQQHGFENLYNLDGGILAYAKDIDPSIPLY